MHEDLERLDLVDRADREIARRNKALADAELALTDADRQLAAADAALFALDGEASALAAHEKQLRRDVDEQRQYRDRANKMLATGAGDPAAAERQLRSATDRIDALETQQLEAMEADDALTRRRAETVGLRQQRAADRERLAGERDAVAARVAAETSGQRAERDRIFAQLPRDLQTRYEDFLAKKRWAVAHIVDGACAGCQRVVNQQHVTDLQRGILKPCMGCGRWLVPAA